MAAGAAFLGRSMQGDQPGDPGAEPKPTTRASVSSMHSSSVAPLAAAPLTNRPTLFALVVLAISLTLLQLLWAFYSNATPVNDSHRRRIKATICIDINRCDAMQFALLPSVGPVLADRIVADRDKHGPFASVDNLGRVRGIAEKTLAQIRSYCTVRSEYNNDPIPGDGEALVASTERNDG